MINTTPGPIADVAEIEDPGKAAESPAERPFILSYPAISNRELQSVKKREVLGTALTL
jgi:hypothetical protein